MTGTVSKRKTANGGCTWAFVFDAGKKPDGTRRQVTKSGFATKKKAQDGLRDAIVAFTGTGISPTPGMGKTLREFYATWLRDYAAGRCERTTFERYGELAEYAMKKIGHVDIDKLGPKQIEDALNDLQRCGGRVTKKHPGGRPLAPKTISHIKTCLHTALKTAHRWGMLQANPMELVQMPPLVKKEQVALNETDMDRLLIAAEGTRLHPFLTLAFATGCRRGELLCLQWSDLDTDTGRLSITKTLEQTKTYGIRVKARTKGKGPRSLIVPGSALDVILAHRERQQEEKTLIGPDYGTRDLIFCQPDGSYYSPDKIGTRVSRMAKKAGFDSIHLHSLRHSHASQMLSNGVPLPTVSKRLGHADPAITAKVYAHALPEDDGIAAEIWNTARRKTIADKKAEEARTLANVSFGVPAKRLTLVKSAS